MSAESSQGTAEVLACAWCGAPHDVSSRPLGGRTVCGHCGVATTDPWPTEAELDVAYEGWYRPGAGRFDAGGDILLRMSRGALSARLDRLAPPGPILDVGCGDGHLVAALRRRGRRAVGLERVSTGPDIMEGEIDDVGGEGTWAAVVFWHSLEHLAAPGHALDVAGKLLAPDGVLIVAVPNAASWQAKAFGERWFALDLPRHLVHIPARALSRRLARNQIAIERVSHYRGGQVVFGWLHGLVGVVGGYDLYDAIRRAEARRRPMSLRERLAALAMGVVLTPFAGVLALVEVAGRRGGTVYVEGRRA